MWSEIPEEIKIQIFLFDQTRKDLFDQVVHQIRFIPVLFHLQICVEVGQEEWRESIFFLYKSFRITETWLIDLNRRQKWNQFKNMTLRKIQQ